MEIFKKKNAFGVYPCYDYSAVHTCFLSVERLHRPGRNLKKSSNLHQAVTIICIKVAGGRTAHDTRAGEAPTGGATVHWAQEH
jgi:hypothetical protein